VSDFQSAKNWLVATLGLPRDALHIYVGLIVFLGFAALFRLPLRDWRPIAATLVVAVAGEIWDLIDTHNVGARPRWDRNWHDIWNTMLWPTVLWTLARWTKVLRR
jgi:hypothetical protein